MLLRQTNDLYWPVSDRMMPLRNCNRLAPKTIGSVASAQGNTVTQAVSLAATSIPEGS